MCNSRQATCPREDGNRGRVEGLGGRHALSLAFPLPFSISASSASLDADVGLKPLLGELDALFAPRPLLPGSRFFRFCENQHDSVRLRQGPGEEHVPIRPSWPPCPVPSAPGSVLLLPELSGSTSAPGSRWPRRQRVLGTGGSFLRGEDAADGATAVSGGEADTVRHPAAPPPATTLGVLTGTLFYTPWGDASMSRFFPGNACTPFHGTHVSRPGRAS